MTLGELLVRSRELLAAAGVEEAHLESELLLRHALGIARARLFTDLPREASPEEESSFQCLLSRKLSGEPTAYITGHREFYGLDFQVDRRVLIPRPESELLVEEALSLARKHGISTMADIGTGSGCIAVSVALNLPGVEVYATDVSASALRVARLNCRRHGVSDRIRLREGDLLDPLQGPVDLIVANLPYVCREELSRASGLAFEPAPALDGGVDGLDLVRRLCLQVPDKLNPGGFLLMEIGEGQAETILSWLRGIYTSAIIKLVKDLRGLDRMVSLRLPVDPQLAGAARKPLTGRAVTSLGSSA